jgi:flagellar hook-associated protein 1 FlgK
LLTARSGLLHVQRALASAADDVANADTAGHTNKTVAARALAPAGHAFGVRTLDAMRDVDAALATALDARRSDLAAAEAREALLQGVEIAHGTMAAGDGLGDYNERHLVECCIGKLKHFRRVATRYEKTARNYLAIVTILWLR